VIASLIAGAATAAAVTIGAAQQPELADALLGDGIQGGLLPDGGANVLSAVLWSVSLWFVSPLQLLLLFLGKIETERPSDWIMQLIGRGTDQPVDNVGYEHPAWLTVIGLFVVLGNGCSVAFGLTWALGDPTWAISSGIATCMAAGVYELGRPERISGQQAVELEEQWKLFGTDATKGFVWST
jgi:hypothetical protein